MPLCVASGVFALFPAQSGQPGVCESAALIVNQSIPSKHVSML